MLKDARHNMKETKIALVRICQEKITQRINEIQKKLSLVREARNNQTKSSAGDKYETGRAMMQIEEQNNQGQLADAHAKRLLLKSLDLGKLHQRVDLGSLVYTNRGTYFIVAGFGKVLLEDEFYYCISPDAPIGKKLMGKHPADVINFNQVEMVVERIE